MAFIKLSILKMYGEIFVSRRFRTFLWIVATFMLLWTITCSITTIFQCTPIEYNWDTTITSGHCINYGAFVLAAGALNIVTDFTLLLMPIPLIWRLHTSKQKKWQIILTFAMGSSACIVSIVRLAYSEKVGTTADGSWDNIPAGLASAAELMVGFLAASMPTYRPLYRRLRHGDFEGSNGASNSGYEYRFEHPRNTVKITGGNGGAPLSGTGINVTNQFEMNIHPNHRDKWVRAPDETDDDHNPLTPKHGQANTSYGISEGM
ncbi:hypothetical protein J7T55_001267 [Diaporthe amygdali]|uniref:uncharacterized protein n=1 Tax=Phomopsis amygdali TaxID=1214568 RepID=UPI0022FDCAE5|nr:uncharacterized protein J7T55_001267 [Diaporthe amygdali]KAJ0106743.1 hypothetical protein J7T55_001267 [Diaporthe amygdali]